MRISPTLNLVVIIEPNHIVDEETEEEQNDGVDEAGIGHKGALGGQQVEVESGMQLLIQLVSDAEKVFHVTHDLLHTLPFDGVLLFAIRHALHGQCMNPLLNQGRVWLVRLPHVLILDVLKELKHRGLLIGRELKQRSGDHVQPLDEETPHILSEPFIQLHQIRILLKVVRGRQLHLHVQLRQGLLCGVVEVDIRVLRVDPIKVQGKFVELILRELKDEALADVPASSLDPIGKGLLPTQLVVGL